MGRLKQLMGWHKIDMQNEVYLEIQIQFNQIKRRRKKNYRTNNRKKIRVFCTTHALDAIDEALHLNEFSFVLAGEMRPSR